MILARGLNMAALVMFLVGLIFVSVPFALAGATLGVLAAFSKDING